MNELSGSFMIEINGEPIAKAGPNAEDSEQATIGPDGAIFILKDQRLRSGDSVLARATVEDRSFLPKPVRWCKTGAEDAKLRAHPVTVREEGGSYEIRFAS